jgi:hypothetical protein
MFLKHLFSVRHGIRIRDKAEKKDWQGFLSLIVYIYMEKEDQVNKIIRDR